MAAITSSGTSGMRMSATLRSLGAGGAVVVGQLGFEVMEGSTECSELELTHLWLQHVSKGSTLQLGERVANFGSSGAGDLVLTSA
jgi:hypothetical protein